MTDWTSKARRLATQLVRAGDLDNPGWQEAIRSVPRHLLVPRYYHQNEDATWTLIDGADRDDDDWLDTVYSDTTLVTALDEGTAVSSSTSPGLMTRMLDALDVHDGHRVLEIGTGSGYNAGLLCHRLGGTHVFSVDVDADLANLARTRLAAAGHSPTIVTRDGAAGLTEHAPYDRIMSTCAVPAIPQSWITQVTEGGLILTDFKPSTMAGNLVLLRRRGDTVTGQFLPEWGGFMTMRHVETPRTPPPTRRDHSAARERTTTAPSEPWNETVPWFLAALNGLPADLTFGWTASYRPTNGADRVADTWLSTPDGSWCEVSANATPDGRRVLEGGPVALWRRVEMAFEQWHEAGEPDWPRLGLTITATEHTVWLDSPDGRWRWRPPTYKW